MRPVIRQTALAIYLAVVLIGTLAPLSGSAFDKVSAFDKLMHLAMFGGLAFLLMLSFNPPRRSNFLKAVVLASVLAGGVELVQGILPFRSAEWWDFVTGAAGTVVGAFAALAFVANNDQ